MWGMVESKDEMGGKKLAESKVEMDGGKWLKVKVKWVKKVL